MKYTVAIEDLNETLISVDMKSEKILHTGCVPVGIVWIEARHKRHPVIDDILAQSDLSWGGQIHECSENIHYFGRVRD